MVIRSLFYFIVLSCLVIPCLNAKPVSLNALIEAEEKQKTLTTTPSSESETSERFSLNKLFRTKSLKPKQFKRRAGLINKPLLFLKQDLKGEDSQKIEKTTTHTKQAETSERFSLNKILRTNHLKSKRFKKQDNISPKGKRIPSLQFKRKIQIKSPLKQKNLKYTQTSRRPINQSTKREVSDDEKFNRKYLPLLRSLSMLFDNMLDAESGDSLEYTKAFWHRRRNTTRANTTCTCKRSDTEVAESTTTQAAIVATAPTHEVATTEPARSEAASSRANHFAASDISRVGWDSNVPPLPAGDTSSPGRDDNGISQGSSSSLYPSAERNISGDNRNSEHDTRSRENNARSKNYPENTFSPPRNNASSTRFGGGNRRDRTFSDGPVYRRRLHDEDYSSQSKTSFRNARRDFVKPEGQNQFENRGDKAESSESIREFVRGDRRFVPEDSISYYPESIQPQKDHEKDDKSLEFDVASAQRIAVGNGSTPAEDQKINETNTAVISTDDLHNPFVMLRNSPKNNAPYVTIFDGYSVARDKNGANKLAEHSIRVHTQNKIQ